PARVKSTFAPSSKGCGSYVWKRCFRRKIQYIEHFIWLIGFASVWHPHCYITMGAGRIALPAILMRRPFQTRGILKMRANARTLFPSQLATLLLASVVMVPAGAQTQPAAGAQDT